MTLTCLGFALVLAAQAPQTPAQTSPPTATAVIRGRVTGLDSGQPLRKAQVRVIQFDAGPGRENRTTTTDVDGRYEFTDLPAGRYVVNASKGAYVTVVWG